MADELQDELLRVQLLLEEAMQQSDAMYTGLQSSLNAATERMQQLEIERAIVQRNLQEEDEQLSHEIRTSQGIMNERLASLEEEMSLILHQQQEEQNTKAERKAEEPEVGGNHTFSDSNGGDDNDDDTPSFGRGGGSALCS